MTAKIYVDTNILVYAHDSTAGAKHQRAREILVDLWKSGQGCLSVQVLQEFYVTVTQKVACPMAPSRAANIIQELSAWRVHQPSSGDVLHAIAIQERCRISFWDAMILQSAIRMHCASIWSEDLNAGQLYDGIRLVNPFTAQDNS